MTGLVLTPAQYAMLLEQIPDFRVRQLRGQSHLEAWDVRRTLIRIFGFGGWDLTTKDLALVREIEHPPAQEGGKPRWTVVYRAEVRLTIKNPDGSVGAVYEDAASGDSQNQPSLGDAHDQAMKTALSQGLKRCAVNLGDQFGMSLYNDGRTKAVVLRTLAGPDGPTEQVPIPHDETPVQGEPEPAAHSEPEPGPRADTMPNGRPIPGDRPYEGVPDDYPDPPLAAPTRVQQPWHRRMHILWRELGYGGEDKREFRLRKTAEILGLPDLNSSSDLTREQANKVIAELEHRKRARSKVTA